MPKYIKYTKDLLEPIVAESKSFSEVARKLGLTPVGGTLNTIRRKIRQLALDDSHFTGQAWAKGLTVEHPTIKRISTQLTKHTETSLIDGVYLPSKVIRKLLAQTGRPYECQKCQNTGSWQDERLVLHVDHVNGDNYDNRPENLRYLCPNCHSQTPTFGSKNKRPRRNEILKIDWPKKRTVDESVARQDRFCSACDAKLAPKQKTYCSYKCAHPASQRTSHTPEELYAILTKHAFNFTHTAAEVGVSDNAIRKRLKNAGYELPKQKPRKTG